MISTKEFRALICAINSQYIHSSLASWYLVAGINQYCDSPVYATVFESTVNEDIRITADRILSIHPDFIGFSCYIWNMNRINALIPIIKNALPECIIALGGPEVSYNAKKHLENRLVDYVISGEGEYPLAMLIDSIITSSPVPSCGISCRSGENIIESAPYYSDEEPPDPYSKDYFSNLKGRISYIETSRGCPFSCSFCLSGRCRGVQFFDLERCKRNIILLANSGSRTIKFVDRTFNANPQRAATIVRFICENYGITIPDDVCFHFEIAGDLLDDRLIELFSAAPPGSIQLEIGLQSFNEEVLQSVMRKTNVIKLTENIKRLLQNNNIHLHLDLIAGLPFEDYESFGRSFNQAYVLQPHMLQLGFLKLLHGAPLEQDTRGIIFSADAPYEVVSTPWLTAEELKVLKNTEHALDLLFCSGRFITISSFLMDYWGLNPFEFYTKAGEFLKNSCNPYDICRVILENCPESIRAKVRDIMTEEWLCTNSSGKIPPALRIADGDLKKIAIALEHNGFKRPVGTRRSIAILYTTGRAMYVDYTSCSRVTRRYTPTYIDNYKEYIL